LGRVGAPEHRNPSRGQEVALCSAWHDGGGGPHRLSARWAVALPRDYGNIEHVTLGVCREVERDPERGRGAAAKLKALGVKGILIEAAEQGYITQLACKAWTLYTPWAEIRAATLGS